MMTGVPWREVIVTYLQICIALVGKFWTKLDTEGGVNVWSAYRVVTVLRKEGQHEVIRTINYGLYLCDNVANSVIHILLRHSLSKFHRLFHIFPNSPNISTDFALSNNVSVIHKTINDEETHYFSDVVLLDIVERVILLGQGGNTTLRGCLLLIECGHGELRRGAEPRWG
jgi:hypothetical protein